MRKTWVKLVRNARKASRMNVHNVHTHHENPTATTQLAHNFPQYASKFCTQFVHSLKRMFYSVKHHFYPPSTWPMTTITIYKYI